MIFLYFILNFVMCFVVSKMGAQRKIGGTSAFFISFFFSFVVGILFVMASDKIEESDDIPLVSLTSQDAAFIYKQKKAADAMYKEYDYKGAIQAYQTILEINPHDPVSLLSTARLYSLLKNKDKAYEYIQRANESRHPTLTKSLQHQDFDFVKSQPDFAKFASNGYRVLDTPINNEPSKSSLADELEKLANLKEKGIISEEEFQAQKTKVLNRQ